METIIATTPTSEKVQTIPVHTRTSRFCPQCGMACRITGCATPNHTIGAGHERCYGCEWANATMHPQSPHYLGTLTFREFMTR
jgi:hypothetical protein